MHAVPAAQLLTAGDWLEVGKHASRSGGGVGLHFC